MLDSNLNILKSFESCVLQAYQDTANVWTIGWGATYYSNYQKVKQGDVISQQQADELLKFHVNEFETSVRYLLDGLYLPTKCIDALVIFVYNCGTTALAKSTLFKRIKEDKTNLEVIEKEWLRWNKSGGKVLNGLTRRRKAEFEIFKDGVLSMYTQKEKEQLFHKCNLK